MKMRRFAWLGCLVALSASAGTRDWLKKPDAWFGSAEAAKIAENILSWQSDLGGWPKNVDVTASRYSGDKDDLRPTFDNGATTDELRFLARIHGATREKKYAKAFERGFDHVIDAQYPTGGWPQFHPPGDKYHRHITFNDGAMVRLMEFLRESYTDDRYRFLDGHRRRKAQEAFDAGIDCILKCQIKVGGKRTAWCAQHDERTYEPRPARSYELASLSGAESVGIVRLLMSLEKPKPEVVAAVEAAVAWFKSAQLRGIRIEKREGNKVVVEDANAPPFWARFYEIGSNRPIFSDRDGVKKYDLAEIGHERRNGYSWYGNWPQRLLEKEYPAWKDRVN